MKACGKMSLQTDQNWSLLCQAIKLSEIWKRCTNRNQRRGERNAVFSSKKYHLKCNLNWGNAHIKATANRRINIIHNALTWINYLKWIFLKRSRGWRWSALQRTTANQNAELQRPGTTDIYHATPGRKALGTSQKREWKDCKGQKNRELDMRLCPLGWPKATSTNSDWLNMAWTRTISTDMLAWMGEAP